MTSAVFSKILRSSRILAVSYFNTNIVTEVTLVFAGFNRGGHLFDFHSTSVLPGSLDVQMV